MGGGRGSTRPPQTEEPREPHDQQSMTCLKESPTKGIGNKVFNSNPSSVWIVYSSITNSATNLKEERLKVVYPLHLVTHRNVVTELKPVCEVAMEPCWGSFCMQPVTLNSVLSMCCLPQKVLLWHDTGIQLCSFALPTTHAWHLSPRWVSTLKLLMWLLKEIFIWQNKQVAVMQRTQSSKVHPLLCLSCSICPGRPPHEGSWGRPHLLGCKLQEDRVQLSCAEFSIWA